MFPPDSQPLLVLVNSKSGGGQGADMLAAFQRLLNPHQVHSLADGGPLPGYALLLVVLQQKLKKIKKGWAQMVDGLAKQKGASDKWFNSKKKTF